MKRRIFFQLTFGSIAGFFIGMFSKNEKQTSNWFRDNGYLEYEHYPIEIIPHDKKDKNVASLLELIINEKKIYLEKYENEIFKDLFMKTDIL